MPLWSDLSSYPPEPKSKSAVKGWKVRRENQRRKVQQIAVEVAAKLNTNPVSVLIPAKKEDK